jgi:DNA polymerase-3 subunit gamma/tau
LTLANETQREQLQNLKQELLDDIRSKLGSNKISLEIGLLKTEVQAKAYKPVDVFKSMAEKNPSLLELKKRFDLEIDY